MSATKRVLLLNPSGTKMYARDKYCSSVSKADYYWPQVDLIFQSGYLSRRHEVRVVDAIVEKFGPRDVLRRIDAFKPDAILFLTSSASWPEDMAFIEQVKKLHNPDIIALGGWLLPLAKKALERFEFIDAVLKDFATDDLERWIGGERRVNNMVWRDGGRIFEGGREAPRSFEVPTPRHDLFPLDKYRFPLARHRRFTVTNTGVGCPWNCRFCVPGTVQYRTRTVENVIEELRSIKRLGIDEVLFHDATLTASANRATELFEAMIREKIGIEWMCQTRVDCVDREMLRLMKRAGCEGVEFGVESGSDRVLESMDKRITREKVVEAFRVAREEGIHTNAFFIIGMPDETEADVETTIKFAIDLKPTVASFSVPMPHPGTPLGEDEHTRERFIEESISIDDVSPPKTTTGKIAPDRVFELRNSALRRFYLNPSYIVSKALQLRSFNDLKRDATLAISLMKSLFVKRDDDNKPGGIECPLCGKTAYPFGTERAYKLVECRHCGIVFVDPMPGDGADGHPSLGDYYEGLHEKIRPEAWERHGEIVWQRTLDKLKALKPTGRILDVGAGAGHFIKMLKSAGYDACGVEPAGDVAGDGSIVARDMNDLPASTEKFDAVTMFWVIEHLPDPDRALAKIRDLLKPGGVIVVRAPNMGFIRPIRALKWVERVLPGLFKPLINPASNKEAFFELLGPPYHLFGYSKKTLARLLEGHGLAVEEIGIYGGLRTGKPARDFMETLLEAAARALYLISGGRIIFFYDVTVWARKTDK